MEKQAVLAGGSALLPGIVELIQEDCHTIGAR